MCDALVPCPAAKILHGASFIEAATAGHLRTLFASCTDRSPPTGLCAAHCSSAATALDANNASLTAAQAADVAACLACSGPNYTCADADDEADRKKAVVCAAAIVDATNTNTQDRLFGLSCGGMDAGGGWAGLPLLLVCLCVTATAGSLLYYILSSRHKEATRQARGLDSLPFDDPDLAMAAFAPIN